MSTPFGPYALTLDGITQQMRRTFETFIDPRKGKNTSYTMVDAALSACSVFFTPSPSFLEYQRSLKQSQGNHNARTRFGVHEIPADNHIRTLLDATQPETLKPAYLSCSMPWSRPGWWMPTVRSMAHCCWPAMGRNISRRRPFIASGVRRDGTPTAK